MVLWALSLLFGFGGSLSLLLGFSVFRFGFRLRFWGFGGLSSFFLGFARAFFGADFFLFDAKHPRRCLPAGAAAFFIALGGILAGTQPSSPGLNSPISRTYNPFPYQRISENPKVFCTAYEVRSCLTTSRFRMYHSTRENKSNNFFKDIYYNWHNSHTKLPPPFSSEAAHVFVRGPSNPRQSPRFRRQNCL